ncbi:hypothetical protein DY926_12365 [Komagataeibacter melaceti]|uniref:Uncharacterized protein n=2 Tax=Komagataeibacter melaceti TaxID=2766577 RepID=A0A371YYC6_9PROT|nr:hypothetical protein DY926_12365 [Komagataeibacter melaceti]
MFQFLKAEIESIKNMMAGYNRNKEFKHITKYDEDCSEYILNKLRIIYEEIFTTIADGYLDNKYKEQTVKEMFEKYIILIRDMKFMNTEIRMEMNNIEDAYKYFISK